MVKSALNLLSNDEGMQYIVQNNHNIGDPDVDTRLYTGEMTEPGMQLNVNTSSIIQDQKHEF